MTKIGKKKAAQEFFCAVSKVFDRVKTVALWSAKKINKKDHKGLWFRSYSSIWSTVEVVGRIRHTPYTYTPRITGYKMKTKNTMLSVNIYFCHIVMSYRKKWRLQFLMCL